MITCPTRGESIERRDFTLERDCPACQDSLVIDIDGEVVDGRWRERTRLIAKSTIRGGEVSCKIDLARLALEKESLARMEYIKEEALREPIWARLKEAAYSISMSILWLGGLIAMTLLYCFIFDAALSFMPASGSWRWSNAFILGFVAAGLTMMMVLSLVAVCMDRHEPSAWVVLLILLLILCTGMGMWVRHIRAASAEPRAITQPVLTPPAVVTTAATIKVRGTARHVDHYRAIRAGPLSPHSLFELVRATPHRFRQTGLLCLFPPFSPPRNRMNFHS